MKKIILRKMRFNPHEVKPTIRKLQKFGKLIKTQNWSFLMFGFNLTSHGLNLIWRKMFNESLKLNSSLLDILYSWYTPRKYYTTRYTRTYVWRDQSVLIVPTNLEQGSGMRTSYNS